jgi:lipopolysaccharide/colanic/teichoic acid biosynthesis glycosyltransferase
MNWYSGFVKPTFDFLFAAFTLLFFWPILLLIGLINTVVFGKPLFIQTRIGKNERPFQCIKFRSLRVDHDENSIPIWGKLLRLSSIDEMPQVINILRGEMSLIGPRPLLPEYLAHYTPKQKLRHTVKPGITGLAQVSGRNSLSWEQSLQLDVEYAQNRTFYFDLKILARTVLQVFKFGQVNSSAKESRKPFNQEQRG